jgi:hypothetical protein
MKKILSIIFISLLTFASILQAQVCNGVSAEVIAPSPQTGLHNYFGVRVTLTQPYSQDITVAGIIYEEGNHNLQQPFTLTITSGNLIAETDLYLLQTGPADNAGVEISSVSPCPDLATRLANHQSFSQLNLLFGDVLQMPTPDEFIESFDTTSFNEDGDENLSEITGMTLNNIQTINQGVFSHVTNLITDFPELLQLSDEEVQAVFMEATVIYFSNGYGIHINKRIMPNQGITNKTTFTYADYFELKNKYQVSANTIYMPLVVSYITAKKSYVYDPCSDCKRVGRASMAAGIFLGAATGSMFGWRGAWIGAVLGFWYAAEQTLACIKQQCPQK